MRKRITQQGRRSRSVTAKQVSSKDVMADIDDVMRRVEAMDEDEQLLKDTQEIADEEVAIVEESVPGVELSETEDQNERAMDNWPIEARVATAGRLIALAKKLMEV